MGDVVLAGGEFCDEEEVGMNEPRKRRLALVSEPEGIASNAPDIAACEPAREIELGQFTAKLVRKPPSLLARHGGRSSIKYLWALGLYDDSVDLSEPDFSNPDEPVFIVTLEQTSGGEPMLCAFTNDGRHLNLGAEPDFVQEEQFVQRALALVCDKFGVSEDPQEQGN